jgi:predicted AlkP superfamily phosphohydrolase/phosphomutase
MGQSSRVLIIGLDGATWDVLDPWIRDGSLPNLARLREEGSWSNLYSTLPPITAPAWGTFMTGKRPGKHGVFHFIPLFTKDQDAEGKPEIVDARSLKSSTLWDILGHHGREVILVNIPMTYPPRPVNGVMITGLLTPRGAQIFTHPPEFSKELPDYITDLDRFIDVKPFQGDPSDDVVAPSINLVEDFRDMLEKRAEASLSLMKSKPWDLFMVVFTGPDRLGHYLWPFHRNPAESDADELKGLFTAVHDYYIHLDEVIGELIQTSENNTNILIMSDHGMGPKNIKRVHGNNWLRQQGLLDIKSENGGITNPDSWLWNLRLPRDKIGKIILSLPGVNKSRLIQKAASSRFADVDIDNSRAYFVPIYNNIAGIHINLTGESKRTLTRELIEGLEELVDPYTGTHVVQLVRLGDEYYRGAKDKSIPGIVVALKPDYAWGHHVSNYSSLVTKVGRPSQEGDHRLEGILLAQGPSIVPQAEPAMDPSLEDLAPTILYLMDLPISEDFDGSIITELIKPDLLESQPIQTGKPVGFWPEDDKAEFYDQPISEAEEEAIRKRLAALGYLE